MVRTRESYGCYTVVFVGPFRTRTVLYMVLGLALALCSYISLGSPFYGRAKVSILRTHLESSLSCRLGWPLTGPPFIVLRILDLRIGQVGCPRLERQ